MIMYFFKELIASEVLKLKSMNIKIIENVYLYKKLLYGFYNFEINVIGFIIILIAQLLIMQYLTNFKLLYIMYIVIFAANLPKFISMYKLIYKRTLIIYFVSMLFFGILIGYITNIFLSDKFTPIFDLSNFQKQIEIANNINITFPNWFKNLCAIVVLFMGLYSKFKAKIIIL